MDARAKAIVAHITIIGWIVALVMNNGNKEEFASFYLRQSLPLHILWMCLNIIPVVGWIVGLLVMIFWFISIIAAIQGEKKLIPFGDTFQKWFSAL